MEEQKWIKRKKKALQESKFQQAAEFCQKLGASYSETGLYKKALAEFREECRLYERLEMKIQTACAHRMVGETQMLLGDYDEAMKEAEIYKDVAKEENDQKELQRAYMTIGRVYLTHAQSITSLRERRPLLQKAECVFLKSLQITNRLQDGKVGRVERADMEARLYLNIGLVKEYDDDETAAVEHLEKAIKICKAHDIWELLHHCYHLAGLLYSNRLKNLQKANHKFNLALEVAERLSDKALKMCETLRAKAEAAIKAGDFQSARKPLIDAYKWNCSDRELRTAIEGTLKVVIAMSEMQEKLLHQDSPDMSVKMNLHELMGDGWCKLENYSAAAEQYLMMLGCAEQMGMKGRELKPIYVSLYQTYKDDERYHEALAYLQKEYDLVKNEPKEACMTLLMQGEIFELAEKNFWETERVYVRAREEAKKAQSRKLEKQALWRLLELCKTKGMMIQEGEIKEELKGFEDVSDDEDSLTEEQSNTPNIGDEIDIDDYVEEEEEKSRPPRSAKRFRLTRNEKGETPLHRACINGNLKLVRQLIEQGHPVNERDNAGWLPLHEAANHGYKEIVEELLKGDGRRLINDRGGRNCDGISPLFDACCNGKLEVIELLLDSGADPTVLNDAGRDCLNALNAWRVDEGGMLDSAERTLFETLRERIKEALEKAGRLNQTVVEERDEVEEEEVNFAPRRDLRHGLDDSDDSDEEVAPPMSRSLAGRSSLLDSPPRPSEGRLARREYKEAMDRLRKPKSVVLPSSRGSDSRHTALLPAEEVVEDWLEDDLAPSRKKRRWDTSPRKESTQRRRKSIDLNEPQPSTSRGVVDSTINLDFDDDLLDPAVTPIWHKSSPVKSAPPQRSQSPLSTQPDSTSAEIPPLFNPTPPEHPRFSDIRPVAVRIEDDLISVPVRTEDAAKQDINWLALEAAKRYAHIKGRLPELQLVLNGALVEGRDPLAIVLSSTEVGSRVLGWTMVQIGDRYDTASEECKTTPISALRELLETSHPTNSLLLFDQNLSWRQIRPIFKALRLETNLTSLHLGNNQIGDEGVKFLVELLPFLVELKSLDLSGNGITNEGVRSLLTIANDSLRNLVDLNLAFNPIGDAGGENVAMLCHKLPKLSKLNVKSCEIRRIFHLSDEFSKLFEFDVSFNDLTSDSLDMVLQSTSPNRLKRLDLSFTLKSPSSAFVRLFERARFDSLQEIRLAGCHLTDRDVWTFMQTGCRQLETISVAHNAALSKTSLESILNGEETKIQRLFLHGCPNMIEEGVDLRRRENGDRLILLQVSLDKEKEKAENQVRLWKELWSNLHPDETNFKRNGLQVTFYSTKTDFGTAF